MFLFFRSLSLKQNKIKFFKDASLHPTGERLNAVLQLKNAVSNQSQSNCPYLLDASFDVGVCGRFEYCALRKKKIIRNEKRHFLINRTETEINRTFVMNKISKF